MVSVDFKIHKIYWERFNLFKKIFISLSVAFAMTILISDSTFAVNIKVDRYQHSNSATLNMEVETIKVKMFAKNNGPTANLDYQLVEFRNLEGPGQIVEQGTLKPGQSVTSVVFAPWESHRFVLTLTKSIIQPFGSFFCSGEGSLEAVL